MNAIDPSSATRAHFFHVDLSDAPPEHDYIVVAADHEQLLTAHTEESKQILSVARVNSVVGARLGQTTHCTGDPVLLPMSRAYRVHVKAVPHDKSQPEFVHAAAIIVPKPDLAANEMVHSPIDWVATAQAFLFHHPDLQTPDPGVSAIVMEHLEFDSNYGLIEQLAVKMRRAGKPTLDANKGWATLVPVKMDDGDTVYMQQPTQSIMDAAGDVMTRVMISTKNDPRLQNKTWMFTPGASTESSSENQPQFAAAIRTGEMAGAWKATVDNIRSVFGMKVSVTVLDPSKRQVNIHFENYYVRFLGAYIQFLDADMRPMNTPDWRPDDGLSIFTSDTQYDHFRGLGAVSPIMTVMAIPVLAQPGTLDVQVTFPPGAVAAGVFGCGLSMWATRPFPNANILGGILTGLANLTIPSLLLTTGVLGGTYKPLYETMLRNPRIAKFLLIAGATYFAGQGAVNRRIDFKSLAMLGELLFSDALFLVLAWVKAQLVGGSIKNAMPFAGWIVLALNTATGLIQMAMTIVHVASSPWNIPNRVSTTIDSTVTILPDPQSNRFPQPPAGSKASCTVNMIFNSPRPTVIDTLTTISGPMLTTSFANQLGGRVKFEANFYIDAWLAATASTGWMKNDQENTANVTLMLVQNPVPITDKSVYVHSQILTYEDGRYQWMESDEAPTSTIADGDSSQTGNAISVWQGLTLSQRNALLGWAWKAAGLGIPSSAGTTGTQLFAMQAAGIPGGGLTRDAFPPAGFDAPNNILFDPYPPKFLRKDGRWVVDPTDVDLGMYWIDPRKSGLSVEHGGGYHLRRFDGSFNTAPGQSSWGRFEWAPDSLVIHPTGHVVAINTQYAKIMVLKIEEHGAADDALPLAQAFAGKGIDFDGSQGRAGLLVNPVAVTCSYDGTILILERLSSATWNVARIQAFDINGNPVDAFKDGTGQASPFLQIDPSPVHLDITCSGNQDLAYIHVLSYRNQGTSPSDYAMSIYQYGKNATPANPLVTTNGMSAARIVTDMWHSLYALNWEMTTDGEGNPAGPREGRETGPAGRTVPSISLWMPPVPKP